MKRMAERLLTTLLSATLIVASIPTTAFAEERADAASAEEEALEVFGEEDELEAALTEPADDVDLAAVEDAEEEAGGPSAADASATSDEAGDAGEALPAEEPQPMPLLDEEPAALNAEGNEASEAVEASEASEAADAADAAVRIQGVSAEESALLSISYASVNVADQTYSGEDQTPEPTVTLDGAPLTAGTDYAVEYENNTEVGTATVIITGIGAYEGTVTATFAITACPISGATVGSIANKVYTGKAITPEPSVMLSGKTLTKGTDYTLSYKNNVKAGTATVTIRGKGNYDGTKSVRFTISARAISQAKVAKIATQKWTNKAVMPKPKVTYGGKTLKAGTDYKLYYKNNVKAGGTATVIIKGRGNFKGSKTVTFKIGPKTGAWKKSGGRWWYRYLDGTYPRSQFLTIDGSRYYFDGYGWMATGWHKVGKKWYYFGSSGAMARSRWIDSKYYVGKDGAMYASTWTPDGYWVNGSGLYTDDGQVDAVLREAARTANKQSTTLDKLYVVAQSVYYYVQRGTYKHTSDGTYRTSYGLIIKRNYTCAGTATMSCDILRRMGYQYVTHTNDGEWTHQWAEVWADGEWWIVEGQLGFAVRKADAPNYPDGGLPDYAYAQMF